MRNPYESARAVTAFGFNYPPYPPYSKSSFEKNSFFCNVLVFIRSPAKVGVLGHQRRGLEWSQAGPGRIWGRLERLYNFLMLFLWILGATCGPKGANMAPTWAPRWSPNRTKFDAKN